MAQIKSLAFLTVIARSQNLQPLMQPHRDAICCAIVRVMQTVPDVLSTRKELLIALRNILPTPFRCIVRVEWGGYMLSLALAVITFFCLLQGRPPAEDGHFVG